MTISKHERNRISELEVDIESYKRIHKDYKKALDIVRKGRDSLTDDITNLRKERDELIMSNHKVIQDNTKLQRKLDDVVDLFNAHLHHKKAWSDNPYYDRVQQRLNKIMEGYPLKATRLRRLYSTEIEQALKNKDLSECLFLLEKIKMDLEEDGE
ncbi:hypothetical protein [Staphylococcus pseudintermedius]|uniref:hypothetical protein n=1 Tax=Staphylococcus pseudintermedius TaxID=283734 RepID=UPI003F6858DD